MKKQVLKLYVGDWSNDGHGKCEDYYIISSHPLEAIQQAYKDTCRKIGVQLNSGEDFTGLERDNTHGSWRHIATEYEDNEMNEDVMKVLVEHGCTLYGEPLTIKSESYLGAEDMFELFMWFVTYSMPEDFQYERLEAESINGFGNLNIQIGYGCFY